MAEATFHTLTPLTNFLLVCTNCSFFSPHDPSYFFVCANEVFTLAITTLIKLKQKVLRLLIVKAEDEGGEKRVVECNEYQCVMNDWAPPAVI